MGAIKIIGLFSLIYFFGCSVVGNGPARKSWGDLFIYPRGEIIRVTIENKEKTRIQFCGKLYDYNSHQLILKLREFDEELYEETRDVILWQKPIHIQAGNDYILTIHEGSLLDLRLCGSTDQRPQYDKTPAN